MTLQALTATDVVGYLAGALVLATFYLRTMLRLRMVAICSNVAFITYGALTGAVPILILHSLLLPLNSLRLLQMKRLIARIRAKSSDESIMSLLVPFMQTRRMSAGSTLFEEGDQAEVLYYVMEGWLATRSYQTSMGPGSFVGEIGILSPDHKRSDTVICKTDVELAAIPAGKIWELLHQHPELGAHLIRIVAQRAAQASPGSPAAG